MPDDADLHGAQMPRTTPAQGAAGERLTLIRERILVESVQMTLSGQVATAVVRLRERDRHVASRTVGRNLEPQRLGLVGDAAARALTELLPIGYGILLTDIRSVGTEVGEVVVAAVTLLTPEAEQVLMGVAGAKAGMAEAAVRAILGAVNRRLSFVFTDAPLITMN